MQSESATTTAACIFEQSDDGFVRQWGQKNRLLQQSLALKQILLSLCFAQISSCSGNSSRKITFIQAKL
jgi:hypothetical protein